MPQSVRINTVGGPLLLTMDSMLFDPERPRMTPDDLLRERGGKMVDMKGDRHNCPFCNKTMAGDLFRMHLPKCVERNYHTIDITHHTFRGGGPNGA